MELPQIIHDVLLHQVDEPHDQHVEQVLHAAQVQLESTSGATAANEHSPLLKTTTANGTHNVSVDLGKVEAILDAEEKAAIQADHNLSAWTIVNEETVLLIKLAIPMVLAATLEIFPAMLLSMMIGHVDPSESTQILAAYSLSGLVQQLLIFCVLNGFSSAVDTLCSQAFGAKKMTQLWLFCQAGLLMFVICVPIMVLGLICGSSVLQVLGQDPVISDIAGELLLVSIFIIPFGIAFTVMKSALQAQNIVFPFVVSSLVGWIVSGIAAYLLAFHTSLGYLGIAIATPVYWFVKSLVLLPVVLRNDVFQQSWPGWKLKEAVVLLPMISKLGVSSVLMVTFQMLGFTVISLLAGLLPSANVMITANGIFGFMTEIAFLPLVGICIGGAVRMGNALGAGKARRAALISHIVMVSSVLVAFVAMIGAALIAEAYAQAFTPDRDASRVAVDLIYKTLPIIPLSGFIIGIQSIVRACGKQLVAAQLNFVCLFVLGIPLSLYFAMVLDGGLVGLWYGDMVGLFVFVLTGLAWFWRLSWDKLAHEAKHNTNMHTAVAPVAADAC
uniref:Uncharacterized protein n=1 Tax=Globisporangium ultimum (strain ATCC 200006 / CBS 805.95 / DAOM BR144) TaxID=431595 RepID=K3WE47_GLOUD